MHVYRIFAGLLSLKVLSLFVKDIPLILRPNIYQYIIQHSAKEHSKVDNASSIFTLLRMLFITRIHVIYYIITLITKIHDPFLTIVFPTNTSKEWDM